MLIFCLQVAAKAALTAQGAVPAHQMGQESEGDLEPQIDMMLNDFAGGKDSTVMASAGDTEGDEEAC